MQKYPDSYVTSAAAVVIGFANWDLMPSLCCTITLLRLTVSNIEALDHLDIYAREFVRSWTYEFSVILIIISYHTTAN